MRVTSIRVINEGDINEGQFNEGDVNEGAINSDRMDEDIEGSGFIWQLTRVLLTFFWGGIVCVWGIVSFIIQY